MFNMGKIENEGERKRERERERERERKRQTETGGERETSPAVRHTNCHIMFIMKMLKQKEIQRQADRQTDRETELFISKRHFTTHNVYHDMLKQKERETEIDRQKDRLK